MSNRALKLVGGLLATGALAVAPVAASAHTSSTATISGSGGSGCQDNNPPSSNWGNGNGWYGHDGNGSYWRGWGDGNGNFGGNSSDRGCNGSSNGSNSSFAQVSKVARVMVAVQRIRGSQCQHLSRSGKLGRPGSCSATHWFPATGTRHWHHNIGTALPTGRYRLKHRAIDAAGNRGKVHVRRLSLRAN